ncbi:pyrroline-5-carboxylate reductase [Catenovulum adriaticum]|uniref:Pyrroline-5-carboxylate reductase n=1 Tax=Catenovulum adriaticum TaxID=2984846 RepID=A0ABY7AHH3_9ALTE|nr:pyrroline-5-carboxylate reductase [Catenovulum sp. TS8]WAJ69063.1 pyrroline-5-carboxylate reductase [Catenovulum sp. TS8]
MQDKQTEFKKVAFIGAGNMTASIISGMVKNGYPSDFIFASNPSTEKLDALNAKHNINISQDNSAVAKQADIIILAVKPQLMADMLSQLSLTEAEKTSKLFISIAAGLPVSRLLELLNAPCRLIRTMPNTPSLLGLGMTGLFAPQNVTTSDKEYANQIMSAVGKTVWVEDESGIDHIIALAGSAPAYFFLFMEGMIKEAVELGFDEKEAKAIVQQVALGSAEMVKQNDVDIATLRAQVTSKGGTTACALESFNQSDLTGIIKKAMQAAISRSQEMAKLF